MTDPDAIDLGSVQTFHGDTTDTVGRVPIQVPMPDGQHGAIARDFE